MKVTPPGVSNVESIMEEVESPDITVNFSDKDTNVNMGEGMHTIETTKTTTTTKFETSPVTTIIETTFFPVPQPTSPPPTSLHEAAKERYELFVKQVSESKSSLKLQVNEIRTLMAKELKNLDDNYNLLHKKVHVVANVTTHLIEDITAFNNNYLKDIKVMNEKDDKVFKKVEDFLSNFKETLLKVDLSSQSSISQDSISTMVSKSSQVSRLSWLRS
ncbi:unnamed protein product [Lactuca saligna]|uniref:Uncharacterized protein n=1 Tax=Lactuca saligna TaxID=75948 RepID=A0AA35VG13_LACSI|nr:unnamed protein product [Lactuca saligna]